MSIWTAKMTLDGKRECARCHKMFLPRTPDQKYGPTCARKVAALDVYDERGNLLEAGVKQETVHERRNRLSVEAVEAYLNAGLG